jgi:RND family efflux transporter MFP subunit
MKELKVIALFLGMITLAACGEKAQENTLEKALGSGDLQLLKEAKAELSTKQHNLTEQLDRVSKEIAKLDTNKRRPLVSTFEVNAEEFKHFIEVQAGFDTEKNVVLYAEYSGMITDILVKEGQRVKKGQLLAKIDEGGLAQQLIQAEVQADLSKTTYEKQKSLWDQKIGSEIEYLRSKADYEAKQKMVEQLNRQIEKTRINAPFAGVIDEILMEDGNMASPGVSGIIRLLNLDEMYAEAEIPEVYIQTVNEGKKIDVYIPVLQDTIQAVISQVNNYINPENRSFKIEARVENEGWKIKPNMNAKLRIADYVADSAISVPKNIISEDAEGKKYLYVATDREKNVAVAKKTFVDLGRSEGDRYEILNGLSAGASVIEEGARTVLDGQKVEILNQ